MRAFILFPLAMILSSMAMAETTFEKIEDVAQYQHGDWSNFVREARNITIEEAYRIAEEDPSINFFFHVKGWSLILDTPLGQKSWHYGDAVFFGGKPQWGTAPGLADGYVKRTEN